MNIIEYVVKHTERGECQCGKCIDSLGNHQPEGHTVDMVFFKVAAKDAPEVREFVRLTRDHKGAFTDIDPLDGKEHNYMELGGWIGDQGLAMLYMALGVRLEVFSLLSPALLGLTGDMAMQVAGVGLLSVQAKPVSVEA